MSGKALAVVAWRSKVYDRFTLTEEDVRRLGDRFLTTGILTKEDIQHELIKAQHWLRDNPAKAARKRCWYKFFRNWLSIAEDNKRARSHRFIARGGHGESRTGASNAFDRALGLESEE